MDRATEGDKLIGRNVSSLKEKGLYYGNVANGVKKAMDGAACFRPPADVKAGAAMERAAKAREKAASLRILLEEIEE